MQCRVYRDPSMPHTHTHTRHRQTCAHTRWYLFYSGQAYVCHGVRCAARQAVRGVAPSPIDMHSTPVCTFRVSIIASSSAEVGGNSSPTHLTDGDDDTVGAAGAGGGRLVQPSCSPPYRATAWIAPIDSEISLAFGKTRSRTRSRKQFIP